MNKFFFFLLGGLVSIALPTQATVLFGSGLNSAIGGRTVPSLNLGIGTDSFEVLTSSVGVATKAYSHSAYSLGGYWTKKAGDFFFGQIISGFGIGAIYAHRTFKDMTAAEEKKEDFALGPALFSRWKMAGPFFVSVEAIVGVNVGSNIGDFLAMNYRDQVNLIIGFEM